MRKLLSMVLLASVTTLLISANKRDGLTRKESDAAIAKLIGERREDSNQQYSAEWSDRKLESGEYSMPFYYKVFGEKPSDGRAMYISMHGGGGTTAKMNDGQWNNQKKLYTPHEGVYFVPRSPTNTWNMWHQGYMDSFIEKIIEMAVIKEGVNPNKVYIMGYSAGGDGTYQLAPRLADRWAAAAMSAGHPGDAHIENLRNLPFALYMGGKDGAYNRNGLAVEWGEKFKALAAADNGGYIHDVHVFGQYGHWMEHEDAISMDWMPQYVRNPIPERVVWYQDDILRKSFYWLHTTGEDARPGDEIIASYSKDGKIVIENSTVNTFVVGINDAMMNLDKPVTVFRNGKQIFKGRVNRHISNIESDVNLMLDENLIFPVKLMINGDKVYEL